MEKEKSDRRRMNVRDLTGPIGILNPGPANSICDVEGVLVGHSTIDDPDHCVHTGVTAIVPHSGSIFRDRPRCAIHVANGYGKFIGLSQIEELGEIETPIILTNTLAAPIAASALIDWTLKREADPVRSINPVVGEVNDGRLNDIRNRAVQPDHIFEALSAATQKTSEGCVGAGAASEAYGYKGGIGTASRVFEAGGAKYTLGCLVCTNQDGHFTPLGRSVPQSPHSSYLKEASRGSIVVVLATDAPMCARQLGRLARRAPLGIARSGSAMSHGSGDYAIAFSSVSGTHAPLPEDALSVFFQAAMEATEEAILSAMFAAKDKRTDVGFLPRFPFEQHFG